MSTVSQSTFARDLGLVGWQIRYEQRGYWRNRGHNGILKRMQGTPLPRWAYVTARIGSTCLVTLVISVTVIVGGVLIWGLHFRAGALPGLVVTMVFGTAAFTALGIGITRFIPNAESGPVVVNLLILPLTFISNIWFPTDSLPSALKSIAGVFPVRALANGLQFVFDPRRHGAAFDAASLRVLAVWTVIGVVMTVTFLRQPQGEVA